MIDSLLEYEQLAKQQVWRLDFRTSEAGASDERVSASNFAAAIEKNKIGTVTTIGHSHPNGYSEPSGYDRLSGKNINPLKPTGDAKSATEYPTNAKGDPINRHVYVPRSNKAYKYDATKFYPAQVY